MNETGTILPPGVDEEIVTKRDQVFAIGTFAKHWRQNWRSRGGESQIVTGGGAGSGGART